MIYLMNCEKRFEIYFDNYRFVRKQTIFDFSNLIDDKKVAWRNHRDNLFNESNDESFWKKFVQWCKNQCRHLIVRDIDVIRQFASAQQRFTQSVQQFIDYLQRLWSEHDRQSFERKRMNTLKNRVLSKIAWNSTRHAVQIITYETLIQQYVKSKMSFRRSGELSKLDTTSNAVNTDSSSNTSQSNSKDSNAKNKSKKTSQTKTQVNVTARIKFAKSDFKSKTRTLKSKLTCFACERKSHIKTNSKCSKYAETMKTRNKNDDARKVKIWCSSLKHWDCQQSSENHAAYFCLMI